MYTIYRYTNKYNGKMYIGQTSKTLEERAQSNGRNYRECRHFYAAIQKYSWSAFEVDVLEVVDNVEKANEREKHYIALYNTTDDRYGYNIAIGGDNHTMPEESRKIISEKAKNRYLDKAANPMYNKSHTEEAKEKQRQRKLGENNPMYGSKWTDTQKERSGTRGKKLNLSDEQRLILSERIRLIGKTTGLRPVHCIEDDTIFDSIKDAANTYGVSKSTLCGHLTGHQKTCRGKHFEYIS